VTGVQDARPSHWPVLFELATSIITQAEAATGGPIDWSFGGGTALMLQIDHRESHDIDLFLGDPQLLPYLNPITQDYALRRRPEEYDADGSHVMKLIYGALGEIDFICCAEITGNPSTRAVIEGRGVDLETPAEIIAKKIFYRGSRLQPRDMFDLAAVALHHGDDYVVSALAECGREACVAALNVVEARDPATTSAIMRQLMVRERTRHLADSAQEMTRSLLQRALTELDAA